MIAPVDGVGGRLWRTATFPIRLLAPAASITNRVVRGEFWVETEHHENGPGPDVSMASGSDIQRPSDGAGPLNHRRYRVHIDNAEVSAIELIDHFRRLPNDVSPTSFATFDPQPGPAGMALGDELTVRLPGPWDGPVVVTELDVQTVRLETRGGHMEAGWIRFTAFDDEDHIVFEIESLARSGDSAFDLLYHPARVAKLMQTEMWIRLLEAVVSVSGGELSGRPTVHTTIYENPEQQG